jgi:FlaA1/EpsC-like NDP-sugar epimerase
MTIPEAVSLVLQASTIGQGGEVLVLDMGEPVRIVTLAEELIRLHGMKPYVDIDIAFTGLRPGEKLFEEILTAEEGTMASKHEKVFIAQNSETRNLDEINKLLDELKTIILNAPMNDAGMIRNALKNYVKYYSDTAPASESLLSSPIEERT